MNKLVVEESYVRGKLVQNQYLQTKDAVVIIPRTEAGEYILVQQYRAAVKNNTLEFPAGGIEADEYPEHAAYRELAEETGYRATEMNYLFSYYPSPGIHTEQLHVFSAQVGTQDQQLLDENEEIEVLCFEPATLGQMIEAGQIIDGKTIMGWLYLTARINPLPKT